MQDFFGNIATFLGGVLGGGVGFLFIAFIILILFIPIAFYLRSGPVKHTGLETFQASLDKPDKGWRDDIPGKVESDRAQEFGPNTQPAPTAPKQSRPIPNT